MTATISQRWFPSGKRNPCPICGREKDGDCRTSGDGMEVICHHPKDYRPGEIVQLADGPRWAFTGNTADGRAGHFVIDKTRTGKKGGANVVPFRPRPAAPQPAAPQPAPMPPAPPNLALLTAARPPSGSPYSYTATQRVKRTSQADGGKRFCCEHLADGRWVNGAGPDPWPMFNQGDCGADGWPLEIEGEKCVELVSGGGVVGISQPGHAHGVEQIRERYETLSRKGVPGIVFLADHDDPGSKRAQQSAEAAALAGMPFLVLHAGDLWPDLPKGGSIDDAPGTITEQVVVIEVAARRAHAAALQIEQEIDDGEHLVEEAQAQPLAKPKRHTLAPDEVMALLPDRLGHPRLNIRTNEFHCGSNTYAADEVGRLYLHLSGAEERWPKETTADALVELAKDRAFDPVEVELTGLGSLVEPLPMEMWQRLDLHLLGISDPIAAIFLPQFLISAVARVFRPGCSVRRSPVLIGTQWRGKTTLGRILFGEAHWIENVTDLGKDDLMRLQSAWGVELAELNGVTRRKDQEQLKSFLTAREDVFRAPYGKGVAKYQRRCVFWGTSNGPPLRDLSGSTRFVCIPLPDRMLPLDWATQNRAALWSRAVEQFRQIEQDQEPWDRASEEERAAVEERNSNHQELDPWAEAVMEALAHHSKTMSLPVSMAAIFERMNLEVAHQSPAHATRVRAIAEALGWELARRRPSPGAEKRQGFWPPTSGG
jgi:hypothetical protein